MHIPDGYLSPSTCAVFYAASAPFLYTATRKARRLVSGRLIPLLSVFAAFSFVIMMFNVPLPGGTSGHAVGATLAAIVLGPWAAMLVVATALTLQAIFFGDGGILSLGANIFNMAITMSLVAWAVNRLIVGGSSEPRRRVVGAAAAGYLALNVAAFFTAIEFGIQPVLFRAADGAPLYSPYGFGVAIPAMMIGHLLIAGPVEALISGLAVAYLLRANPDLLNLSVGRAVPTFVNARGRAVRLWGGIAALVVLAPIGLLAVGTAWGEWNPTDTKTWPLPFVPEGLKALNGIWSAPLTGYGLHFLGSSTGAQVVGYVASAAIGVVVLALIGLGVGRLVARGQETRGH